MDGFVEIRINPMQYLITTKTEEPFFTDWFDPKNDFNAKAGMVVYDLYYGLYTTDGKNWKEINEDHS
jgi:hypothetical protein